MAGNIIPAIATTNAIVAGFVVLFAFRILQNKLEACQSVYLRKKPNHKKELLVVEKKLNPPNPKCYVCAPTPEAILAVDTAKMTIKELEESVLKGRLNMIAPDVMIDGLGTVVISSEEGETEENNDKLLEELKIKDGAILKVDDFHQNFALTITVVHREKPPVNSSEPEFLITANEDDLKPKEEEKETAKTNGEAPMETNDVETSLKRKPSSDDESEESKTPSKKRKVEIDVHNVDNDDDISIVDTCMDVDEAEDAPSEKHHVEEDDDDCLIVSE